ncbi:MAG: SusC/RagA family TonB-linked outer membrane protein [Balneolaceae bacterium]|nr:SusC/RagA family TonB-linked outer membrane protein [Balneolaceae bacterium]
MKKKILRYLSSFIVVMLLGGFSGIALAQTGTLTGTITDDATGEALVGATVLVTDLQRGAPSNIDGEYTVENIPVGTYEVRFSYIGYRTLNQEITITEGENVANIELALDAAGLDEVVVTGVATIDRQAYTGSAATVRTDRFENVPVSSVDQALQGAAPGLNVSAASGTPGAQQSIRIRGISSVNAGVDPLYVIDGVPVVSGSNAASTATSSLGVLSNINPSDIESITVLKDAASTAPYGARGSNGVIVITTKQGVDGRTEYSASAQLGFNNRAVPGEGAMSAPQYDDLVQQTFGVSIWDGQTDTDWGDVILNDNAAQQEYTLSARGGNETTNFYVSGGIFGQEGPVIGSSLDRYSGSVDITHRFDDRVRISNSLTGSFVEQDGILEGAGYFGSPILAEYFMLPIDPAFNADGTPNIDNLSTAIFNPVFIQDNDINRKRNYRLLNNATLTVNLQDNLAFSSKFAIDYLETVEKYYRNRQHGDGVDNQGSVEDINNRNINLVWQNSIEYLWDLDSENSFTFRGISETQKNYFEYLYGYGTGIAADGLFNLNTTANPQSVNSITTDWGVQSFTGLVNYGWRNKIYYDMSFRYEGNYRFSDDVRWGSFWSVGLAYILTEEDFFRDISWLDYLRARVSYGKTGNADIGLNQFQATVGFGSYNNMPHIIANQLGNPNLTWETAYSMDLSLEFEMFEFLSGSATFFRRDSQDLLFDVPLSRTTGHTSQTQNVGDLYNQGIELELNANILRTQNVSWSLGGNLTTVQNEVTNLPVDGDGNPIEIITGTRYVAVEGYAVNTWFMREWAGVDPANGDPLWFMDDGNGGRTTTNNWNEATEYSQGASAQPTLFGGINTRLDVMDFFVSANLYYSFGNKIYDGWAVYMRSDGEFVGAFGQYERQADRWQQPGDVAENPLPVAGGNNNSNQASTRFLYDGDYLRLTDLSVGYNIPNSVLQNVGLNSATVYMQGRNLWTYVFDDDLKMDPYVGSEGFLDLFAPPMKSVTLGVKFNF